MKLVLAIVNNDDSARTSSALTEAGFAVTRLSTTGGFLMVGNTTFLIGTEDDRTREAIEILKEYCTTRSYAAPVNRPFGLKARSTGVPEEIQVGGATIFVLDVAHMEKI